MSEKIEIPAARQKNLSALYSAPKSNKKRPAHKKTLVIMLHGLHTHKTALGDLFGDIESLLAKKYYHSLRFDFGCCGESDGAAQDFTISAASEDLQNITSWASKKGYEDFIFIAEGLGATVAILNSDCDSKALALFWPLLDLPAYAQKIYQEANDNEAINDDGTLIYKKRTIGFPLIQELNKIDLPPFLEDLKMPILIMQGLKDEEMPPEQLDILREHISSKRVEITTFQDGGESLPQLNHRKLLFHYISEFIDKNA